MEFQVEQLVHLSIYASLLWVVWGVKNKYMKGIAVLLGVILFTMSPVRQVIDKSAAQSSAEFVIPEKVIVKERVFNTHTQLKSMKEESKERYNEITK